MSASNGRSRRDLLTGWFTALRDISRSAGSAAPDASRALRPPGALVPDGDFLAACSGCGDCVPACPTASIIMFDSEDDCTVPGIDPSVKPCYLCDELPCVAACPDGALVHSGPPEQVRMGIAKVDPRRCVTFRGELCRRCYEACPYPDRALMMIGARPLVGSGACTGCGLCEKACPEHPKAIVVIPERELVPGLRIPKGEYQPG